MGRASGDTTGLKVGSPEWWAEENYRKNTTNASKPPVYSGSEPVSMGGATGRLVNVNASNQDLMAGAGATTQATQAGAGASDGPTGVEAYNQSLAYKTYIDTLATLIKQTGQLHTFNGLDARGMPIFTPLFNDDGSPKRPQDYYLTQAQIDKYAADIVFQKAQAASEYAAQASKLTGDTGFVYMYKGNNADGSPIIERQTDAQGKPQLSAAYQKQLFDANMTRQTALASMIANPTTYVAGAALANQMGARMGSTPVASRPSYVMASGVGNATAGGTASTGSSAGTSAGVSAMGAGDGSTGGAGSTATGYPSVMPSAPTGADAMSGRSAVTLDVSPSMIAALTGNRVSASGNPTGVYGGAVSLPDATPLSGDFGKINIADWRRMNDTTQKQYASLALANQPGLTSDDLTKRIAAQAPGTAAWS